MPGIHQEIDFAVPPARVYAALTDSQQFVAATGAPAEIGAQAGDAFSCFGGMITGRHIELVPDKTLIQAWRAGNWAPGAYSIVRFDLSARGNGTQLVFDHTGFPDGTQQHLEEGWKNMYWDKLQAYLG